MRTPSNKGSIKGNLHPNRRKLHMTPPILGVLRIKTIPRTSSSMPPKNKAHESPCGLQPSADWQISIIVYYHTRAFFASTWELAYYNFNYSKYCQTCHGDGALMGLSILFCPGPARNGLFNHVSKASLAKTSRDLFKSRACSSASRRRALVLSWVNPNWNLTRHSFLTLLLRHSYVTLL